MVYRTLLLVLCVLFPAHLWNQTEGVVQGDGVVIHYRSFGEGRPILIINGGPGMNSNGFEMPAKKLSEHYRTIIYDQRGTGGSKMDKVQSSTITLDLMIADIEQLRKSLRIEHWIVLGHSFGGMLASYYATVHPERIDGIILSSSGGIDLGLLSYVQKSIMSRLSPQQRDSVQYWDEQIEQGDSSYHARYRRGVSLAPAYSVRRENIPKLAERLTQGDRRINSLVWEDLRRIQFNCAPKLTTFLKPVLIIQGKQDIVSEETAIRSHNAFKRSTMIFLDNCCHYGWLDNEKEYFSSLEYFLAGIN